VARGEVFRRRLLRHGGFAVGIMAGSLGIGIVGYHYTEGLGWLDAFLNAAMILSGMGPATELHTAAGKWFAGCYALFSGVAFITTVGVMFAPLLHRALHKFHLELGRQGTKPASGNPIVGVRRSCVMRSFAVVLAVFLAVAS